MPSVVFERLVEISNAAEAISGEMRGLCSSLVKLRTVSKSEPSELSLSETALLAHACVTCHVHSYFIRENRLQSLESLCLRDVVKGLGGHSLARHTRDTRNSRNWDEYPFSSLEGRERLWSLLAVKAPCSVLHLVVVIEARREPSAKCLAEFSSAKEHWWACVCSEDDFEACVEDLRRGLHCGSYVTDSEDEFPEDECGEDV